MDNNNMKQLEEFFQNQKAEWTDAGRRFDDLQHVSYRRLGDLGVQFNPARIVSTGAKVDKKAIAHRACFLCKKNRPSVQRELPFDDAFEILINPYPILPVHFTIPAREHRQQSILGSYKEIHKLLDRYTDLMVFYNGPKCGASAPDHMHLQAGSKQTLPLIAEWDRWEKQLKPIISKESHDEQEDSEGIYEIDGYPVPAIAIISTTAEADEEMFRRIYLALPLQDDDTEPMLNVVAWRSGENFISIVFPRRQHRPKCYYAEGPEQMLISPGALDLAGLTITPRKDDFERITREQLYGIMHEVTITEDQMQTVRNRIKQPSVNVGIMSTERLHFALNGEYVCDGQRLSGQQEACVSNGKIAWNGKQIDEITFAPATASSSFSLASVTIGVNFHWEQQQTQTFSGALRLIVDGSKVVAINILPVEDYLESVISSEMSATASLALLKAHAVISRSWLLAQMRNRKSNPRTKAETSIKTDEEFIRWYDRDDHTLFDVCADDHCQRYQGITRETTRNVGRAVEATRGEVLTSDGEICDARFSKCCGGITEEFQYCWDNISKPYLKSVADTPAAARTVVGDDEPKDSGADANEPFCNTKDPKIIGQVLNDFDQSTTDFYRWHVDYSQEELSALIKTNTGIDFGNIIDLKPIERGPSGRISRLKIVGTKRTYIYGKELEIRRILSRTHLYSSAFSVERTDIVDGTPQHFRLNGSGWGHGVGLCQIGAAVMGERGYTYQQILKHYYRGAAITKLY